MDNEGMQLSVAMSYSGRSDIAAAARSIARLAAAGLLDPEQVGGKLLGGEGQLMERERRRLPSSLLYNLFAAAGVECISLGEISGRGCEAMSVFIP